MKSEKDDDGIGKQRSALERVVISNLKRIRTMQGKTQRDFAKYCGFKDHSAYTKKERGTVVIDLEDLNEIMERSGISLLDLFNGHPKLTHPGESLKKSTLTAWPFLRGFIDQLNRTAEDPDEVNLRFLIANLEMITARIKEVDHKLERSRVDALKKGNGEQVA